MHKTLSLLTLALVAPICAKPPAAQSFISDPYKVKVADAYYFSLKSGDSAKLMMSDLTTKGTKSSAFTFQSLGSMASLGNSLIFVADQGKGSELYRFSPKCKGHQASIDQGPCGGWLVITSGIDGFGRSSVLLCE